MHISWISARGSAVAEGLRDTLSHEIFSFAAHPIIFGQLSIVSENEHYSALMVGNRIRKSVQ